MKELNLNQYNRHNSLRIRKFSDEYYMLGSGKCYKINETGAIVVKYVGKDMPIEALGSKIMDTYNGANIDEIIEDIKAFVDFLLDEGLINENE